jgi:Kef-type K+ transport system membrane component KefB
MNTDEMLLLRDLGWIVVVAAFFSFIGRWLKVPTIVVYLFAGLLLGPAFGVVSMDHSLEIISELGIALLLFLVGLELSLDKIRDVGKVAFVAGIGQVVFTAAGGMVIALLLGFGMMESLFIATALTFSSTVVVVKLLDQKGDLNKLYGRIAVGIFLVQDLVVIVILTFLSGLAMDGSGEGAGWQAVALGLGKAFGGMGMILVLALVASRYLLPRPFGWAARSPDTIFIWALCWCFGMVLLAKVLGLSLEIGAFIAGLALAQLPYNDDLRRRLHPLMNFFVAVFFVSLGIRTELGEALAAWPAALVLSLFVLIGNPLIFMIIISRMKYRERTAFFTSITVAQISEFSFIFAALGVASGLIGSSILSVIALVGVVTIVMSAYMIIYCEQLYALCRRFGLLKVFRAGQGDEPDEARERGGHCIVVGMSSLGHQLVARLLERGERVLAVDTDPGKLVGLGDAETVIGNVEYEAVVEEIGLSRAKLVVSALQIEDTNHLLAYRCRSAGVACAVHAFDIALVDDLLELDTAYLMMPTVDAALTQREWLRKEGVLRR